MRWSHNDAVDWCGGWNWVRGPGEKINKLNTTIKWEMGETTIGVIPDYDSESAVDFLNGWVINRI